MTKIEHPEVIQLRLSVKKAASPIVPPFKFALVEEGLYRGAYPQPRNYPFLRTLSLKTIISLLPDLPSQELQLFCSENSIKLIHILVEHSKEGVMLTASKATQVLQMLIDSSNFPIYLHCSTGTSITGLIIMCLRKLQLWNLSSSVPEFCRYSKHGTISEEEEEFVNKFGQNNHVYAISLPTPSLMPEDASSTLSSYIESIPSQPLSQNEIEISKPLPKWLWSGTVPINFVKSTTASPFVASALSPVVSQLSPSSTAPLSGQALHTTSLNYAHPTVRIKLSPDMAYSLLETYQATGSQSCSQTYQTPAQAFLAQLSERNSRQNQPEPVVSDDAVDELESSKMLEALALEGLE